MSRTCLWREQEFQSDAEIAPSCSEPVELLEFQLEESEKLSCILQNQRNFWISSQKGWKSCLVQWLPIILTSVSKNERKCIDGSECRTKFIELRFVTNGLPRRCSFHSTSVRVILRPTIHKYRVVFGIDWVISPGCMSINCREWLVIWIAQVVPSRRNQPTVRHSTNSPILRVFNI